MVSQNCGETAKREGKTTGADFGLFGELARQPIEDQTGVELSDDGHSRQLVRIRQSVLSNLRIHRRSAYSTGIQGDREALNTEARHCGVLSPN